MIRRWQRPAKDELTARKVDQEWTVGRSKIRAGAFSYGLKHLKVREWGEGASLTIGRFCSLADAVEIFLGGNHRTDWVTTYPFGHLFREVFGESPIAGHPATRGDVVIGNDVWIGAGATIYSGVTIGDGAVIGGHAVVARDVGPYEVVAGNPARLVRGRFAPEIVDLLLQLQWWSLPETEIREITPLLSQSPDVDGLKALVARYR